MIYLGKYYEDMGVNTSINITRIEHLPDDEDTVKYVLNLINNVSKQSYIYDTDDGMTQISDNPYYYTFDNIDTDSLTDGEYTYTLYKNDVNVASGLLTYRANAPKDTTTYNKTNEYIVYK